MTIVRSRTCAGCGIVFELNGGRGRPRRFCTDKCKMDHPEAWSTSGIPRDKEIRAAVTENVWARAAIAAERAEMPVSEWINELLEDTFALEDVDDEIVGLVEGVVSDPFEFELERLNGLLFVRAKLWRRDTVSGEFGYGYGARYLILWGMDPGEIVKKCFVAARDFAEHEVREGFKYLDRAILGPHIPIDRLWEAATE